MRVLLIVSMVLLLLPAIATAQFTGPNARGQDSTVEQARNARVDTYVTVTGNIVAHLREDYFTFRDSTGEIRVEIEPEVWRNREVGPDTTVRLLAEVDRNAAGTVYLWVQSLELVN
ncbi:YgiW/YdeI family stress tolerance OB fold protein [Thiocapsa bogorovii]|uniref:YgiW/YdeI family stress tolerance OB fold protein n=1 Tax=Thiocapsa bogorovii TaxID=521689 RepID=UPI001E2A16C2|nr:NirD/YgiW/YdeI family stress tolerance protein [Thiocapsa bogorovii]UHD17542.1 NirD/YgiW/YdeI family stress tolerance protein [Thiocapsa bogorovii]